MDYEIMDYDDPLDSVYYEDDYDVHESIDDVLDNCVKSSVYDIAPLILKSIGINILYFLIRMRYKKYKNFSHLLSVGGGCVLLNLFFNIKELLPCAIYMALLYAVLKKIKSYFVLIGITTFFLIYSEFYYPYLQTWLAARGLMMIFTMKFLSLSKDLQDMKGGCSFLQYLGYILCPANLIMGPWIRYSAYEKQQIECLNNINAVYSYIWNISKRLLLAVAFLTLSNCWLDYFIAEDSNILATTYRRALSFRSSHYFISYTAEAGMVAAGFPADTWFGAITQPLEIEAPRSLVTVVIAWNKPFHRFLHSYVYKSLLSCGPFTAILATYFMSSLLHGLNVPLSIVLLSLGLFSYVQIRFQDALSRSLNACLDVRDCFQARAKCKHFYKSNRFFVVLLNWALRLLTVAQLAYLGILMDAPVVTSLADTVKWIVQQWADLYYCCHWVVGLSWVYYFIFS